MAGLGVFLCSSGLQVIKGQVRLNGCPLSFSSPLLTVLLLEGMKWEVPWEECDLWWSQAGVDRWWGASLQHPVVMQAIYRLITVLWVPERNVAGHWGCSWLLGITITNVSATNAQTGGVGGSGFQGGGCKLEVGGSPVIGISAWGVNTGSSDGIGWSGVDAIPVVVLDVDAIG